MKFSSRQFLYPAVFLGIVISAGYVIVANQHVSIGSADQESAIGSIVAAPQMISRLVGHATPATTTQEKTAVPVKEDTNSTAYLLKDMRMTFSDDFTTFSRYADASGNVTCKPNGTGRWQTVYIFCSRTNSANSEAEVYTDPAFYAYLKKIPIAEAEKLPEIPFRIKGGALSITARPSSQEVIDAVGPWATFTSGIITTQQSFTQTYGYFEARLKLPQGYGMWPAFWLLPADGSWPPEVDAMESFGAKNPKGYGGLTSIHYASHAVSANNGCGEWHATGADITSGFHTYGVDIEPSGITYYYDGEAYAHCQPNPGTNKPFYMVLNLAVGGQGSWPGAADPATSQPAEMLIDYVRAYQKK